MVADGDLGDADIEEYCKNMTQTQIASIMGALELESYAIGFENADIILTDRTDDNENMIVGGRVSEPDSRFNRLVRASKLIANIFIQNETPKQLPKELDNDEAKCLLDRLCKAGYCDSAYKWVNGTAYQAAQAAYNIGVILWKGNKWKPFETYWGLANMAQTFAKNRLEANQKDIDNIDKLFPENNPPKKDNVKL